MKRFWAVLLAIFWIAISTSLAQIVSIDDKIITFDKLSKTVISFITDKKPTVKIEPSLEGQYSLAFNDGKGTLTFAKPVSAGAYSIHLSSGGKTATAIWKVLPTTLSPISMKTLAGLNLYYGKRLSLRSKLFNEAELPLQQFKIDYQFGDEPPIKDNTFSESWTGPNIPANAKKIRLAIVWIYPPTGERVSLFTKEVSPEQTPPEIICAGATVRSEFDASTNSYMLFTNSINVDYEMPMDADNKDPLSSKSIKATLQDVQAGVASLDYQDSDFQLRVYRGSEPIQTSPWTPNSATFKLVESRYDAMSGNFPLKIQMSNLPANGTSVRGTFVVKANAGIINKQAGISAESSSPPCVFTLDIPINTNKALTDGAPILETKTVSVSADIFLKRQSWFADRMKILDFDVFAADDATVRAISNAITPRPERGDALNAAEERCTNSDEIKKRISKKLPVPQAMIDEGGSPQDCERVKAFYSVSANYTPISQVVMLVSKPKAGTPSQLLGALALVKSASGTVAEQFIASPYKIYNADELKTTNLNGTTLHTLLMQQLATIEKNIIERKVMVETTEIVKH
ncbi:MAG: hypothetical protein ACOVSW_12680 [Candidatus Kapaibacteriota bacterium]